MKINCFRQIPANNSLKCIRNKLHKKLSKFL
jgi:hypothetical protein